MGEGSELMTGTTTRRRIHARETEVECRACGELTPVRFQPVVYIRLTSRRDDRAGLMEVPCGSCGGPLAVTVGDAHRAT